MLKSCLLILLMMTRLIAGDIVKEERPICEFGIYSEIEKNGTIMSPEYPSPYSSNTICTYEFHGNDQERIRIVFLDFDVYCSGDNSDRYNYSDSVSVFIFVDGRLEKIDSYCGNKLPGPIMSNGPWMRIEFKGRRAQSKYRGFKATYSFTTDYAIRIGTQSKRYPCAFNFYSNETKYGYFHSPNFPGLYPRNTECHYFFYGILSEKVALHFSSFDIEGVSSCDAQTASDSVEISNYHGEDRKYTRYCGKLSEFDVESDSRFLRVTFRSNGRLDGTGFNATYYFLERIFTTKKFQEIPRNGGYFHWSTSASNGFYASILIFANISGRRLLCLTIII